MTYNPDIQYRCAIIRGKAKNSMDSLLPAYAQILNKICPCSYSDFIELFDKEIQKLLVVSTQKALDNHRTEIVGKLFGMYFLDTDGYINISQRTEKLLEDGDQPAFFKDICYKFQFPDGMKKPPGLLEDISHKLCIRQCSYVLELLRHAEKSGIILVKEEIGYYVLNAFEVLQGKVPPDEVLQIIISDRSKGIEKRIYAAGKARSYTHQHITEQLNYMELANLIQVVDQNVYLNQKETSAVDFIASAWGKPLLFDVYSYDFHSNVDRNLMYFEWQIEYSKLAAPSSTILDTSLNALFKEEKDDIVHSMISGKGEDWTKLGDEGEVYVYNLEKERVKAFNNNLAHKVLLLGKIKGLGYDVQSVHAKPGPTADYARYIEVKSTKRITQPDDNFPDTVTLTRNEWVAAEQHKTNYSIYRVYFTPEQVFVYAIDNPTEKNQQGMINVTPISYRVDFTLGICNFISQIQ